MELNMKTDQRSHVTYMVKYGSLVLYDDGLKNRYIIDHEKYSIFEERRDVFNWNYRLNLN